MEEKKNMGIWMDHSAANIIDLNSEKNNSSIISNFTTEVKEEVLSRSESHMHNKRQQMHEAYYQEIADVVLRYDHVLLFGPTNAKTELLNYLNKDLHFRDIIIDLESADKMTDNEKYALVKNHFKE